MSSEQSATTDQKNAHADTSQSKAETNTDAGSGTGTGSSTVSSKPPVTLQPSSHLDPGAYVRGSYPITIGNNVLIHPRAHLLSIHGPLSIADGCIVSEKCILGGPIPDPAPESEAAPPFTTSESASSLRAGSITTVENHVHLHPNARVECGATIKAYSIIESNTTIRSTATVGSHTKVCGNLTITSDVPDVTVVWGTDGAQQRRRRKLDHLYTPKDAFQLVEGERLKTMQREREGAISMLKANAAKALSSGSRRGR